MENVQLSGGPGSWADSLLIELNGVFNIGLFLHFKRVSGMTVKGIGVVPLKRHPGRYLKGSLLVISWISTGGNCLYISSFQDLQPLGEELC